MESTPTFDARRVGDIESEDVTVLCGLAGYVGHMLDSHRNGREPVMDERTWTDLARYIDRHRDLMAAHRDAVGLPPLARDRGRLMAHVADEMRAAERDRVQGWAEDFAGGAA